jgi:DNA-binding transcriptional LysR family regulator
MELTSIETFLVLADELHFARTAERIFVSPARVSQRIRALEQHIGAPLFDRSSRRVELTPLGASLRDQLDPLYGDLCAALKQARNATLSTNRKLCIGFTAVAIGRPLNQLISVIDAHDPNCEIRLREVDLNRPWESLCDEVIDVLVTCQFGASPALTDGPVLDQLPRGIAVAANHPLAHWDAVSVEVLGDYPVVRWGADFLWPCRGNVTPGGRPINTVGTDARTLFEIGGEVARGRAVLPTIGAPTALVNTPGVSVVVIKDLPSVPVGLVWRARVEDARIRALATLVPAGARID